MAESYDDLLDRLDGVRRRSDTASALCPAHTDTKASLSVARGADGRVLITCHAGCKWQEVLRAVGMEPSDAFGEPRIVREHVYTDRDGRPLYVVERWEPKAFRQRLADGTRRAPKDVDRVIYNLPTIEALRGGVEPMCFYVEGERDADSLAYRGYAATTTLGGANKPWQPQYSEQLAGIFVVVVADNDAPGRRWSHTVSDKLSASGVRVRVVAPPAGIKDVTELFESGGSVDQLVALPATIGDVASAADIPVRTVDWLWPGRLPAGMLTLLEGDPGTGKSTLAIEVLACLTTGRAFPGDLTRGRAPLIAAVLADEDNWGTTVVPRLKAAGADLQRVYHLRGIRDGDLLTPYSLSDLSTLRHDVHKLGASLLLIDPLVAYFGGRDVDTHRDQHVRSILGPLVQVAEAEDLTILAVRHFTKGSAGSRAIYRGGGSIGFTGQARAVLQTAEHPDQVSYPGQMVLAVAKCNLAPLADSLGYKLSTDSIYDVARVKWDDVPIPLSAQQLQSGGMEPANRPVVEGPASEAREWLDEYLADGEPHKWTVIAAAATEAGISATTLRTIRYEVAVRHLGPGGNRDSVWTSARTASAFATCREHGEPQVTASAPNTGPRDWREVAFKDDDRDDDVVPPQVAASDDPAAEQPPASDSKSDDQNGGLPTCRFPTCQHDGGTCCHLRDSRARQVAGSEAEADQLVAPELRNEPVDLLAPELVCRVCGSTDGLLTYAEPVGGRCLVHNPVVWDG